MVVSLLGELASGLIWQSSLAFGYSFFLASGSRNATDRVDRQVPSFAS